MNRPEILDKWNHRDFEYFTERPQYNKNGNKIFDDLEIIIEAVQKFLEYGCAHDMRIVQYDLYGTIGVLRNDRSVSYTFKLIFETEPHDEILPTDFYGELNFHEVAKWSTYETGEHLGYLDYVCLLISADHETDILNSITRVQFGNVVNVAFTRPGDYDTCREGERERKLARFHAAYGRIKRFVKEHEDIQAWLILQGINIL